VKRKRRLMAENRALRRAAVDLYLAVDEHEADRNAESYDRLWKALAGVRQAVKPTITRL
jgi:hypothetical protein